MFRKIALTLALCCAAAIAAPDVEVSFSGQAQLGQLKLEPGLYKVKLVGNLAMFTSTSSGKTYSTVTKPEKASQKANVTAVLGSTADGVQRVESIVMSGSEFRLTFGQ